MSMLAEPRRKQRISVDPQNLQWGNDESRVGKNLMDVLDRGVYRVLGWKWSWEFWVELRKGMAKTKMTTKRPIKLF